jgi:hypothetical protein
MSRFHLAATLLAVTTLLAATQVQTARAQLAPEPAWVGAALVTFSGSGCDTAPDPNFLGLGGPPPYSIYRPRLSPATPVNSALSFSVPGATVVLTTTDANSQLHGSGTYNAVAVTSQVKTFSWSGSYAKFQITPKVANGGVKEDTVNVTIAGTIGKWFGKKCALQFRGAYTGGLILL